jgi:hypothetical protein
MRVYLLAFPLAGLVACAANDTPDSAETAGRGTTRQAIDRSIRDDLRLAFTIGSRCALRDQECRAAVTEDVRANQGVAQIAALVGALSHEEICRQLTSVREPNVAFAVGAGNIGPQGQEGAIAFDLGAGTGTVLTASSGLSAVYLGGAWEAIAGSSSPLLDAWAGAFVTREASLAVAGADVHFATDAGLLGAAMPSASENVKSFVTIDGSSFESALRPSGSSVLGFAKALGPIVKSDGLGLTFVGDGKLAPKVALAATLVQLAGFKGLAPRAAAIAIGTTEGARFEGGVGAYCSTDALTVRSFGVKPLGGHGGGTSLDDGFSNLETTSGEGDMPLDCSSGLEELSCGKLFNDPTLICANAGRDKNGRDTSCCRKPITDPAKIEKMKACTPGPDSGCGSDSVCSRAAESGPTSTSYVCVPKNACAAFEGNPEPLPGGTDRAKRKCSYFVGEGTSVISQSGAVVEAHGVATQKCLEYRKNNDGATDSEANQFCNWVNYVGDDKVVDCSASTFYQSRCTVKIDRCLFSPRMEQPYGYGRNR